MDIFIHHKKIIINLIIFSFLFCLFPVISFSIENQYNTNDNSPLKTSSGISFNNKNGKNTKNPEYFKKPTNKDYKSIKLNNPRVTRQSSNKSHCNTSLIFLKSYNEKNLKISIPKRDFNRVIDHALNIIDKYTQPSQDIDLLEFVFTNKFCFINNANIDTKIIDKEKEQLHEDLGLKFVLGARTSTGNLNLYNRYTYFGFTWDLGKNGFFENKLEEKELSIASSSNNTTQLLIQRKFLSECRENEIDYYFAKIKLRILKHKVNILERLYSILRKFYFSGQLLVDDVFKINLELEKTKTNIKLYKDLLHSLCHIEHKAYCNKTVLSSNLNPIISLKFNKLIASVLSESKHTILEKVSNDDRLASMLNNWIRDVKLQLYLKFATKGDESAFSKKGVIAGFNFSIPIGEKDRSVEKLKLLKSENQLIQYTQNLVNYLNLLYREVGEKESDAVKMWYSIRLASERLRRSSVKLKLDQANGYIYYKDYINFLYNYRDFLDSFFEFVSSEELLYRRVIRILTISGAKSFRNYITFTKVLPLNYRERKGLRFMLLNEASFKTFPPDIISYILYAKGFKGVIIPYEQLNNKKICKFTEKLKAEGIKIYQLKKIPKNISNLANVSDRHTFLLINKPNQINLLRNLSNKLNKNGNLELPGVVVTTDIRCNEIKQLSKIFKVVFLNNVSINKIENEKYKNIGMIFFFNKNISELTLEEMIDKFYDSDIRFYLFGCQDVLKIFGGGKNSETEK
jgi:hypothetical protein